MHTPEIQMPTAGRRRTRYSDQFKRDVIAACREPGASVAAIGLANGLNANMVRRWVVESARDGGSDLARLPTTPTPVPTRPAFIPVKFDPAPARPSEASLRSLVLAFSIQKKSIMAQRANFEEVSQALHDAYACLLANGQKWPRKFEQLFKWKFWA